MKNFKKKFMKEKIFTALKASIVDVNGKTSISDRTLNAYAERLSTQIADESQIAEAIKPDVIVLKEIVGNISAVAAEAVKAVKPVEKPIDKPVDKTIDIAEPAWFTAFKEQQKLETEQLKQKVTGFEKKEAQSQLMGKLTSKLKEKGISESFWRGRNLSIESEADIDTLATTIETDFDVFRQEQADSGVVLNSPKSGDGGKIEGILGAKIAEAQNAGKSGGAEGKKIVIQN